MSKREQEIIAAAAKVFQEKGYHAATTRDIKLKAISCKESPSLAGLFAHLRRCRFSFIALLCAFRSALQLTKHPAPYGRLFLESA